MSEDELSPALFRALSAAERHELQIEYQQALADEHEQVPQRLHALLKRDPGNSIYVRAFLGRTRPEHRAGWWRRWTAAARCRKLCPLHFQAGEGESGEGESGAADEWKLPWAKKLALATGWLWDHPSDIGLLTCLASLCQHLQFGESACDYMRQAVRCLEQQGPKVGFSKLQKLPAGFEFPDVWNGAAAMFMRHGHSEAAMEMWRTATKHGVEPVVGDAKLPAVLAKMVQHEPDAGRWFGCVTGKSTELKSYQQAAEWCLEWGEFQQLSEIVEHAARLEGATKLAAWTQEVGRQKSERRRELAEAMASVDRHPKSAQLVEELLTEQNRIELEVLINAAQREPENVVCQLELAEALKRDGNFFAAIKVLAPFSGEQPTEQQTGTARPAEVGAMENVERWRVELELGECRQRARQFALAEAAYGRVWSDLPDYQQQLQNQVGLPSASPSESEAVGQVAAESGQSGVESPAELAETAESGEESPAENENENTNALSLLLAAGYRLAVLREAAGDVAGAANHFAQIVQIDKAYKDAAERLYKLQAIRHKGKLPGGQPHSQEEVK